MSKKMGGVGLLVLVLVMLVVLLLVAQSWRQLAPAAIEVSTPGRSRTVNNHGESAAGEALRQGSLPDLKDARGQTDQHASAVGEALDGTE